MKPKWEIVKGRKNEKDRILLYYGHPITFEDVANMCRFIMKNEDDVYDKPWHEGGEKFIKYMKEVLDTRKIPSNEKYQLGKKETVLV